MVSKVSIKISRINLQVKFIDAVASKGSEKRVKIDPRRFKSRPLKYESLVCRKWYQSFNRLSWIHLPD